MRESRAEREVHKRMYTTPSIDSASDAHHNDGQSLMAALSLFQPPGHGDAPCRETEMSRETKFTLPDTFGALPVPRSRRGERLHVMEPTLSTACGVTHQCVHQIVYASRYLALPRQWDLDSSGSSAKGQINFGQFDSNLKSESQYSELVRTRSVASNGNVQM